ncbi:hypothetical protein [Methylophaga nitratireducenticrescens]|uniref:hypothetical protein n=1 Tax=Methylophaga nitratireducenticrescens TaxID=754476 RepID=UPI001469B66A|nr:hypothetical protein [Methylophaga nitratireducenticrescens]
MMVPEELLIQGLAGIVIRDLVAPNIQAPVGKLMMVPEDLDTPVLVVLLTQDPAVQLMMALVGNVIRDPVAPVTQDLVVQV